MIRPQRPLVGLFQSLPTTSELSFVIAWREADSTSRLFSWWGTRSRPDRAQIDRSTFGESRKQQVRLKPDATGPVVPAPAGAPGARRARSHPRSPTSRLGTRGRAVR